MASPSDGRKRRSFLPAPKKSGSGLSPTSPQSAQQAFPLQQSYHSSSSSTSHAVSQECSTRTSGFDESREAARSRSADSKRTSPRSSDGGGVLSFGRGLRVGARVKIGGVKQGILRYLGTTHLAPGIFCGIELFESDGCHDGEVNGHRYFSCRPNHGIFAPKEKVCLDPAAEVLSRVSSDSEGTYSSSESLSERCHKALKDFEEPEIEAIDYTTLSPESSFHEALQRGDEAAKRYYRNLRAQAKAKLSTTFTALSPEKSPEYTDLPQGSHDSHKRERSGVSKSSNIPAPSSASYTKLPTFSRSYQKFEEQEVISPPTKATFSSRQPCDSQARYFPPLDNRALDSTFVLDSESPRDAESPFHTFRSTAATKSSDDSEEDGVAPEATLSTGIKKQLIADSRQYLNFTFDPEELNRSLDDSGSDSNSKDKLAKDSSVIGSASYNISDAKSTGEYRYENSQPTFTSSILSTTFLDEGERWLEDDSRLRTSTPVSGHPDKQRAATHSGSYTVISQGDYARVSLDASHSGSEQEVEGVRHIMETTRSIADSELPPEFLPVTEGGTEGIPAFPQVNESRQGGEINLGGDVQGLHEGGYVGESNGGGSSVGLNLSRTLASGTPEGSLAQGHGAEPAQSRSYTICSTGVHHEVSGRKSSFGAVAASTSYTIVKSDSNASSPCHKHRKISSGSSVETTGGDSSSSGTEPKTDSSEGKGDNMDDSSSGPSPEVSQALEWDYGQEFEGKLPLDRQDNTVMTTSASTGTSDSLSDVLRDMSETSDCPLEGEMASGNFMDDSDSQFETPENDFENIDSLEDFPIFGKDSKTLMTDSGISDKDFEFSSAKSTSSTICGNSSDDCSREDDASSHHTAKATSSDSSQETLAVADTPGSVEEKELPRDDFCSTLDVDDDTRIDNDSIEEGNNSSPSSVVSIEDVNSSLHDKTLVAQQAELSGRENGSRNKEVKDKLIKSRPESGIEDSEMEDVASMPESAPSLNITLGHQDDEDFCPRKERPVSLLSTTSADTGYIPDTDSDMGTLTTNSPCDCPDRLGLEHPAFQTDGPLDEPTTDLTLTYKVAEPNNALHDFHQQRPKPRDEDDVNVDMTSHTEDDRIEADQVNGPLAEATTEVKGQGQGEVQCQGQSKDESFLKDGEGSSEGQETDIADSQADVEDSTGGEKDKRASSGNARKSESKESSAEPEPEKKAKTKKPFKMTKKKMEVIDHKLPNTKVTSRLADYINSPLPPKPKEDEEKQLKKKQQQQNNPKVNNKNVSKKRASISELGNKNNRAPSADLEKSVERERETPLKPEKPKPVIKRTPPKSKWGDIMSQIDASKDTNKPKPKSEVKSSLTTYLNSPLPQPSTSDPNDPVAVNNAKNEEQNQKTIKREHKPSRIKPLPPPPPKIDLSKIKSKLNVPTAASANKVLPKRDSSPSNVKTKPNKALRDGSQAMKDGHIVLVRQPLSGMSSVRSSRTDFSLTTTTDDPEEGVSSKRGSVDLNKKARRLSTNSVKSERVEKVKQNKDLVRRRSEVKASVPPITNNKPPNRALEIRQSDDKASSVSSQRSSTSPTPVILKPVKPKPKTGASTTRTIVISSKQAWDADGKPNTVTIKGHNSAGNQSKRSNKANGSVRSNGAIPSATSNHKPPVGPGSQKEIHRLESLCEARTKELTQTKMQLKATCQAFDAMAAVVNYCCAELNAFECPQLAHKLDTVQKQLTGCLSQIADLSSQKESLSQNLEQLSQEKQEAHHRAQEASSQVDLQLEEHQRTQKDLEDTHNAALTTQRDELTAKHTEAVKKLHHCHDKEIDLQKHAFDRQLQDEQNEHKLELNSIRISHLEEIQELRNKHDKQMEELHKQHRNKLEDITHRFESIKLTLSEKVESLRGECDDLRHRARSSEDALQRDADVKVQMALVPFLNLPKEIESLKTVVDMRNEEIHELRNKNMDLEKQLEEIPIARDKIISLQQKIENLEAIINIKTDHEKQLHEKCQVLMRKYDRESRANKRLSMDYEQVVWRMSQSQEFGSSESLTKRQVSRSPPRSETSSPDPRRRCLSPNSANGEVIMRVKKRGGHSSGTAGGEGDYRLRSRSATFVLEKGENPSGSSSPQGKPRRRKHVSQGDEDSSQGDGDFVDRSDEKARMCHSANAELLAQSDTDQLNETFELCQPELSSTGEMIHSYARSISGVSDSGVYDSLSRSEMFNSSIISTDSEWAASANVSMTLDPDDLNSTQGSKADETVLPSGQNAHSEHDLEKTTRANEATSSNSQSYQFQISLPCDTNTSQDNVVEEHQEGEDSSLDSCTFSIENTDSASVSNSRLTSVSEDFCIQEDREKEEAATKS